jgi:hypothetical protein
MTGEFKLDDVRPWGRNRVEYLTFFGLGAFNRQTRILDCAGGPSSFNVEMTRLGFRVTSVDPLYRYSKAVISGQISLAREAIMAGVRRAASRFVWTEYRSPETLEAVRMAAMKHFLEDCEDGLAEGRYVAASLPELPFEDGSFGLVLCSHFLFTYSAQLDEAFHVAAALEMARVGREVRIFPLLDLDGLLSPQLAPVRAAMDSHGLNAELCRVPYEFQKGGHTMLRIGGA